MLCHLTDLFYFSETSFYTAAPLSLCCICAPEVFKFAANQLKEFIVKGKNQMPVIEFDWWGYMSSLMKLGWPSWLGAAIFIWGWIHQHRCHAILVSPCSLLVLFSFYFGDSVIISMILSPQNIFDEPFKNHTWTWHGTVLVFIIHFVFIWGFQLFIRACCKSIRSKKVNTESLMGIGLK